MEICHTPLGWLPSLMSCLSLAEAGLNLSHYPQCQLSHHCHSATESSESGRKCHQMLNFTGDMELKRDVRGDAGAHRLSVFSSFPWVDNGNTGVETDIDEFLKKIIETLLYINSINIDCKANISSSLKLPFYLPIFWSIFIISLTLIIQ